MSEKGKLAFTRPTKQHDNLEAAKKTIKREIQRQQSLDEKRKIFGVKLEESLIEEIKEVAQQNGIKIQFLVETALKEYLKKL